MGKLDGKTALVTGGARGIGGAVAERFAAEGGRAAAAGRSKPDPSFARLGDAAAPSTLGAPVHGRAMEMLPAGDFPRYEEDAIQ
ncbi:MAG: SDR family NAD(P)-dependent oxidoreductase [Alphaproteobacteria bacterium]